MALCVWRRSRWDSKNNINKKNNHFAKLSHQKQSLRLCCFGKHNNNIFWPGPWMRRAAAWKGPPPNSPDRRARRAPDMCLTERDSVYSTRYDVYPHSGILPASGWQKKTVKTVKTVETCNCCKKTVENPRPDSQATRKNSRKQNDSVRHQVVCRRLRSAYTRRVTDARLTVFDCFSCRLTVEPLIFDCFFCNSYTFRLFLLFLLFFFCHPLAGRIPEWG